MDWNIFVFVYSTAFIQLEWLRFLDSYNLILELFLEFSLSTIFFNLVSLFNWLVTILISLVLPERFTPFWLLNHFQVINEVANFIIWNCLITLNPNFFALLSEISCVDSQVHEIFNFTFRSYIDLSDLTTDNFLYQLYQYDISHVLVLYCWQAYLQLFHFVGIFFWCFYIYSLILLELMFVIDYSTWDNSSLVRIFLFARSMTEFFIIKFLIVIAFVVIIRSGTPRYRFDYLTKLGWLKFLGFSLAVLFFILLLFYIW